MNRFDSAASSLTLQLFFAISLNLFFYKPNCYLVTQKRCST